MTCSARSFADFASASSKIPATGQVRRIAAISGRIASPRHRCARRNLVVARRNVASCPQSRLHGWNPADTDSKCVAAIPCEAQAAPDNKRALKAHPAVRQATRPRKLVADRRERRNRKTVCRSNEGSDSLRLLARQTALLTPFPMRRAAAERPNAPADRPRPGCATEKTLQRQQ